MTQEVRVLAGCAAALVWTFFCMGVQAWGMKNLRRPRT